MQNHHRLRAELRQHLAHEDYERAEVDRRPPHQWFAKDGRRDWTGTAYEAVARRK